MKQEVFLLNLTSLSCVVMPQRGPRTFRVLNYAVVEGSPMAELTPEERQRIYLEEKARLEVRRELEGQKTSAGKVFEIGKASCRERGEISVGAVFLKKKKKMGLGYDFVGETFTSAILIGRIGLLWL